ncbi:hypothetical protein O0L34_g15283 [Tuta absoluta]|nr:hypothetical protein O0L34_g15283 [Tuta absoluta]
MEKCHDIRNLDTCDFYKSDTILTNGCVDPNMAEFKNVVFHYTSPKMVCPVKAGTYTINNFPYFTTSLNTAESRISTSVFGYTYSIMGYNENEERIFCIEAHLRVNYVRKHDWTVNEIKPNNPTQVPTKPGPNEVDQGHPETVEVGADDDDDDAAPYGVEAREEIDEDVGVEEI